MSWSLLLLALAGSTSQFSTPVSKNAFSPLPVSSWSWTLTLRSSLSVTGTVGGAMTVAALSALVEMSSDTFSARRRLSNPAVGLHTERRLVTAVGWFSLSGGTG